MSHEKRIVEIAGPDAPHAFDGIPVHHRHGQLDRLCPLCHGHGAWNTEYDFASQRSKRHICDKCDGRGWIETGDDHVPSPDIGIGENGQPAWFTRLEPSDDREEPSADPPAIDSPRA